MQKISEIAAGIHHDIEKLDSLSSLLKNIDRTLQIFIKNDEKERLYEYDKLRQEVVSLNNQLKLRGLPEANTYEKELETIKEILNSNDWPEAVYASLICDSEEKSKLRAEQILDQFVCEHLIGKKLLDYGCGDGFIVIKAKEREVKYALGYDLLSNNVKIPQEDFTSNFNVVSSNGPYDIILVNDVLDHITGMSPIEALIQIKSVLSPKGRVYVRNHPWSSRHGGHLYLQKNKAFAHLVLDEIELARVCGIESDHNIKVVKPLETYPYWFEQSGFKIIEENPIIEEVENFFQEPSIINDRICKQINKQTMLNQMKISFVEYVLEPNNFSNLL